MPPSTHGSVSADLAPSGWAPVPVYFGRSTLGRIIARPSGVAGLVLTGATVAVALFGPLLVNTDPFALTGTVLQPPSLAHPMGTDALGRDLLSGVVYGARTSLVVASAVCALAFVCGMIVGMAAGYRGRLMDDLLMRVTELFQVLPRFFLVVVAIALFGPGLDRVMVTLGLTSWPVLARVVRGEVLTLRELDFVLAARATGASAARILWHELLPHLLPSVIVVLGLLFGQVLLVEASLGFLGLADPNALSWGVLAGQAHGFLRVAWWLPLFPGLAITVAVLGLNLLADAMSAALGRR